MGSTTTLSFPDFSLSSNSSLQVQCLVTYRFADLGLPPSLGRTYLIAIASDHSFSLSFSCSVTVSELAFVCAFLVSCALVNTALVMIVTLVVYRRPPFCFFWPRLHSVCVSVI